MKVMRRIQAASLIIALLAVPLTLVARAYACAPQKCTMMCCLPHGGHAAHAMKMDCQHSASGASACMMRCSSLGKTIDYGLASPIAPTQLSAAPALPAPELARANATAIFPAILNGFPRIPFDPPRL
ncbi:MAG: hypothetical protein ACYDDI_17290 [Candidatus Acidiferrales bacterium]